MIKMNVSLQLFPADPQPGTELPLYIDGISCGTPAPSFESLENRLDINKKLIRNPLSTFYAKVNGQSMIDEGIDDGDLLVIDRGLEPEENKIAVCFLDGEFTCKRIMREDDRVWLLPANENFEPIEVLPDADFYIWGIVTHVIKSFK